MQKRCSVGYLMKFLSKFEIQILKGNSSALFDKIYFFRCRKTRLFGYNTNVRNKRPCLPLNIFRTFRKLYKHK